MVKPKKQPVNPVYEYVNHKKRLEKHLNRKVSDRTFFRVKQVMVNNNLPITTTNLEVVARIKIECRKHRIPLEIGLAYYLKIANIQQSKLTGKQFYEYLQKLTTAHRTTIIRWFDGAFKPDKIYSPSDVSKILLHAFMYILRNKKNDSQQKSNRSSTLSNQKTKSDLH